ncbi:glycogen phosphorylase [Enemella dayhoffiae]|uniref:glycogen phosphorylase n=1 Tax=Enemella dayhoffiae TaxID=2016507 RepID=A0A255GUB1_9ACTN|nr:alpha-glucan family phosphorylase [Enemella dayhoffiae]OYO19289.1 glycogen phosphorylase [Enemella dayhoffiae]
MRAIRRFIVQPVLPDSLKPLDELATNLRWAWHEPTRELFRAVDPTLWDTVGHDPISLLSQVDPARLQRLSQDPKFVRNLDRERADLAEYLSADLWFQQYAAANDVPSAIAYFSAEFGISEVLPIYSGGLGILAGDHLKAASDLGVPIIGVGLLYRHGYFRQSLDASGWQQERYPTLDSNALPVTQLTEDGNPVTIEVSVLNRTMKATLWVAHVGRVPLLLMDADVEGNTDDQRAVTDRLYGGGTEHRLAQEVLLGIGGVRAVREFCRITGHATPDVYHANEGHAGFLGLERIREYLAEGMDYDAAVERTRAGNVFTTHTPVPAGIDRFPRELVVDQFHDFDGLPLDRILALGEEDYAGGDPGRFNMAVMGFRLGQRANGVSELHGEVSREMFHGLWPAYDVSEVPIGSITNGVHHRTWIHPELLELLHSPTGDSDTVLDGYDWSGLDRVDDNTIWALKRQMRGDLITMARERLAASCRNRGISADWVANALDPKVLTLGFARRGASYKRLTLMLSEPERLKKLLLDPQRPIQIVIAGKSHPADDTGKSLIQTMVQFADDEEIRHRIVFLPDYDISLARPLYPGCDVWMNNPLRPYEACGTSGMKAALNGAANLSIRDGWWDEWYGPDWGWEIPSAEGITDPAARDAAEAKALYELIENEVVPRFYDVDSNGLPKRWIQMIRDTISGLGPKVLASRMVRDYTTELYAPAAVSAGTIDAARAAELAVWKRRVRAAWPQVRIEHVESSNSGTVQVGEPIHMSAQVRLGELTPEDVQVQLVAGAVDANDEIHDVRTYEMGLVGDVTDGYRRYEITRDARHTGLVGFTVRVVPKHSLLLTPAELGVAALPLGTM